MSRIRKDRNLPAHIKAEKLPTGIYWDSSGKGRWYVFVEKENGKRGTKSVAGADATMADLYTIMETRTTGAARGTVAHVVARWQASPAWRKLSPRSQKDYAYTLAQAMAYQTAKGPLGGLVVDRLSPPVFARLRDKIAETTPAKANAWLRRLKSAFAWGIQDGCCTTNPCAGVSFAEELARDGMPELRVMRAIKRFTSERSALPRDSKGHLAPYLAPFIEIAYQCRLRSVEALALTDASITADGILTVRTKGSRATVTRMNPALADAITALQRHRAHVWTGRPVPLSPDARPLFVSERGTRLTRDGLSVAWQRMLREAVAAGVIIQEQRFTAHGLKHRGITDSEDKRAGGHKSERMRQRYDHEVPVFDGPKAKGDR